MYSYIKNVFAKFYFLKSVVLILEKPVKGHQATLPASSLMCLVVCLGSDSSGDDQHGHKDWAVGSAAELPPCGELDEGAGPHL